VRGTASIGDRRRILVNRPAKPLLTEADGYPDAAAAGTSWRGEGWSMSGTTAERGTVGAQKACPAAADVLLRPASEADWPLLLRWLSRADIERWWGPRASTEAAVMLAMSSEHAICRIVEVAGEPVGYAQALDAMLWGEALPEGIEPGTWDIDLFIAADTHRGRGIGAAALDAIREEVFATTLAPAVCVFAAVANERAVRAYEKAGFRWRGVHRDPRAGPEWFMIAERPDR
jgi:aminoglycoside 6'-N-acetyltransferase